MKKIIIALVLSLSIYSAFAQQIDVEKLTKEEIQQLDSEVLLELPLEKLVALSKRLGVSIDEILNMNTSLASKSELSARETPSIVTLITSEEIEKSGARDLVDILQFVPGLNFAHDGNGVIGLSARGNWAHEGKHLLLLDGQELNEGIFSTTQYDKHVTPAQIERIEIIRGPGSSLYGGYAELGVINIITKSAAKLNGTEVYANASSFSDKRSGFGSTVNFGKVYNDFELSLKGNYKEGTRSDRFIRDDEGNTLDYAKDVSDYKNYNLNLSANYKNLKTRFIYDDISSNYPGDGTYDKIGFKNILSEINYTISPNSKWKITPQFNYKHQRPYLDKEMENYTVYSKYNLGVNFSYTVNKKLNIIGGAASFVETGKIVSSIGENVFYTGKKEVDYNTTNAYLQTNFDFKFAKIFAGVRYDLHSKVDASFSPRIGITKVYNKFHYKLLYSHAFRTPSIGNINLNRDIKAEKTRVAELELGYKLNANMYVGTNLYHMEIKDPIVFSFNTEVGSTIYDNYNKTGSRGIEFEYRARYKMWSTNISYSFYSSEGINKVALYQAETESGSVVKDQMKANPNHKLTVNSTYQISPDISLNLGYIFMGEKYAYIDSDQYQSSVPASHILNTHLHIKNIATKNLSLGIGVYNILDKKLDYVQAYGGKNNIDFPFPGRSREFNVQLKYRF